MHPADKLLKVYFNLICAKKDCKAIITLRNAAKIEQSYVDSRTNFNLNVHIIVWWSYKERFAGFWQPCGSLEGRTIKVKIFNRFFLGNHGSVHGTYTTVRTYKYVYDQLQNSFFEF